METCVRQIRKTVGNMKVLVSIRCSKKYLFKDLQNSHDFFLSFQALLSGGVDSTVLAALLHKVKAL